MKNQLQPGSVTRQIQQLRDGETGAVEVVWERYYERLVEMARRKVSPAARSVSDEEDIVVDAFNSFFTAVQNGRFPKLNDRDDLWQVLVVLANRKAADLTNHHTRQKRGGGVIRGESVCQQPDDRNDLPAGMDQFLQSQPTPEFVVLVAEQFRVLLASLQDATLERIAILKMEGFTNLEIAEQMQCRSRTIDRKLRVIRELWANHEASPQS